MDFKYISCHINIAVEELFCLHFRVECYNNNGPHNTLYDEVDSEFDTYNEFCNKARNLAEVNITKSYPIITANISIQIFTTTAAKWREKIERKLELTEDLDSLESDVLTLRYRNYKGTL